MLSQELFYLGWEKVLLVGYGPAACTALCKAIPTQTLGSETINYGLFLY